MQALSQLKVKKTFLLYTLLIISFTCIKVNAQNVALIIDRSLSVDQENRDEAIELIIDLLEGQVDQGLNKKWTLLTDETPEQDPQQVKLRQQKQQQISSLISGTNNQGIAQENLKILTGHFGDLKTVHALSKEAWTNAHNNFAKTVRAKAKSAKPSDPRTHFELAKATVSEKLDKDKEFLLFVVSDGVEDLDNWPVSHYLDQKKTTNLDSLAQGDFRDTGKARHLRVLNQKHYKSYSHTDQNKLKNFSSQYSELLLGRLTLTPEELQSFFAKKEKKVPVFVYLYYFKPKPELAPQFTTPSQSSPDNRYTISRDFSGVQWQLSNKPNTTFSQLKQTLTLYDENNNELATKEVQEQKVSLNEIFDNLDDGAYKLIITLESEGISSREAVCYIQMSNFSPRIQFTGPISEITNYREPLTFNRYDDTAPLNQRISWKYSSPKGDVKPPKVIKKRILNYDKEYSIPKYSDELQSKILRTNQTEFSIKELLTGDKDDNTQIPLGGSYRIILEALWDSGQKSTITSYFSLPEPKLNLLGNARNNESEKQPRIVEPGDKIRVANWMHGWEDFEYDIEIEEKIKNNWEYVDPYEDDAPLSLNNQANGVIINVTRKINKPLRYRVLFLPNEKTGLSEVIDPEDVSTDYGYLQSKPRSYIPFIFLGCILLAIGFFAWHFLRKR